VRWGRAGFVRKQSLGPTVLTNKEDGVPSEVIRVPDEELERIASENGPACVEAQILARLRFLRAKDRQVFAYRVGDYYVACPIPDAETEAAMIEVAEEDES
jgi:hypothetical protein